MPEHTHYAEPFFGGGAVLFAKNFVGISETVNDINQELTNFWGVLQNKNRFEEFYRVLEVMPLSEIEFSVAKASEDFYQPGDLLVHDEGLKLKYVDSVKLWIDRAKEFFIRYRQSRQALGKDYVTPTRRTRRGMNEQVSAWLSAVEGLPEAHKRLIRVEIRNMDAIDFIKKYDHKDCLFYCDPSYLPETRTSPNVYDYEMTRERHIDLLTNLTAIHGKFVLSGYRSELYDDWASVNIYRRVDINIDNKASSKKTKEIKIESLWMNY